jgi:hypothetical protein
MPRMSWTEREPTPALIVRFDRDRLSLWDGEAGALVEELEERLGGVFVTPAAGPGGPTLRDALAAARFAGCGWAVVAMSPAAARDPLSMGGVLPAVAVRSTWDAAAIARAYEHASGRADEMAAGG